MLRSIRSPVARKLSEDGPLSFVLSITATNFAGKMEGAECTVGCHSSMHMCVDDASTAIMWAVLHKKIIIKKSRNKSPKRFLKRNLPHVGIVQCMNALAG